MDEKRAVTALGALAQESPTLSFHLAQLSGAGLVTSRRNGRSILYAADYDGMQTLMSFLVDNCCQDGAGCAPPAAAPRRRR